jgi:hypothetical protein
LKLQRSSGILNRMPIDLRIRRAVAVGAVTCLAAVQPIAAQSSPSLSVNDPDIKLLFPLAQKVQVMAELCVKELPAQSQGVPAALAAWNERHARPQLDSLIERTMKRRAAMGRGIIRMMGAQLFNGDPAGACSNFAAHISSAENDLSVSDPTALRNARQKLGVSNVNFAAAPDAPARSFRVADAQTPSPPIVSEPPVTSNVPAPDSGFMAPAADTAAVAAPVATTPPARGARGTRTARGTRGGATPAGAATPASNVPSTSSDPAAVATGAMSEATQTAAATSPGGNGRAPRLPANAGVSDGARVSSLAEIVGPAGWQKAMQADGGVAFTVAKNDTGFATLIIYPDRPLAAASIDSALQRWLVAQLRGKLDMQDEFKYGGPDIARTMRGQIAAYDNITPDFPDSRDGMSVSAVAIARANGMFTPVMMITKDDQYQYYRQKEFGRWFATATLPGDVGSRWSLQGSARPGPLQGLWFGSSLSNQLNLYGGMDLIANRHYATFYRNGIVYSELPDGGQIDNMDLDRVCAKDPTDCGTYYVQGKKLITQFPTQLGLIETDTSEIENAADPTTSMTFDGQNLTRVAPVPSMRLNGEFTSIEGSSSGPNGSLTRVRSINFLPDGRYESTGSVGFTSTPGGLSSDNGSVVGYVPGSEKTGTYTIAGYTLTLRPNSGPLRYATIIFFDDERPVKSVLIDDEYYKR